MLHKLSLLMTGLVMMMGAAWFGLHAYGSPETDAPEVAAADPAEESVEPPPAREPDAEETSTALMIARATLNAQLVADAAPANAAVVERVAATTTSAPQGQPIVLAPATPKAEPKKVAARPVTEKPVPQTPKAPKPETTKPETPKPETPKPAAKPKSIDDILDSLE